LESLPDPTTLYMPKDPSWKLKTATVSNDNRRKDRTGVRRSTDQGKRSCWCVALNQASTRLSDNCDS